MIDEIVRRVRSIDMRTAAVALARHLATTSPLERDAERVAMLRDGAATQLRIVTELPNRLERTVAHIGADPFPVGLRLGLHAIVRGVIRHVQVVPFIDSAATALLGPAFVFHQLIVALRGWLPDTMPAPESQLALTYLRLGVPDFMLPLTDGRVVSSWRHFHRLYPLGPGDIEPGEDLSRIDDARLAMLLRRPAAVDAELPPWPLDPCPGCPIPRPIVDSNTLELGLVP